jgi:hypothetical protein
LLHLAKSQFGRVFSLLFIIRNLSNQGPRPNPNYKSHLLWKPSFLHFYILSIVNTKEKEKDGVWAHVWNFLAPIRINISSTCLLSTLHVFSCGKNMAAWLNIVCTYVVLSFFMKWNKIQVWSKKWKSFPIQVFVNQPMHSMSTFECLVCPIETDSLFFRWIFVAVNKLKFLLVMWYRVKCDVKFCRVCKRHTYVPYGSFFCTSNRLIHAICICTTHRFAVL